MYEYFNPNRPTHIALVEFLDKNLSDKKDLIICKTGNRTQHIFRNNKYVITINWGLV